MKKLIFFTLIFIASIPISYGQKLNDLYTKENLPKNFKPDTRIDNMAYWRKMADLDLVPRQARIFVEAATYRGSKISSKGVKTTNSPDVSVTTETSTQSENSIFAHPSQPEKVFNSNNSTTYPVSGVLGANGFYSFDNALTWGGSIQGAGGTNQGDPAAVIGMNGMYYAGQIKNSGQAVAWSDDEGSTWTTVQVGNAAGGFNDLLDKNHLWIDNSLTSPYNGNLYDAWTSFGGSNDNEIEISYSEDNGLSWIGPINISSATYAGSHCQGVNLKTGPQGQVYAIWTIYDSWPLDENAIGMAKSMNGGQSWEPAYRIIESIRGIRNSETSKNMRVNSFPSMAVDISDGPRSGWMYVVWANIGVPGINEGPDIDVYMIRSTDGGANWSDPFRVNQDEMNLGHEHYFPWITCDPASGALSVIFYDDRNVGGSSVEVFCANSYDGGDTWDDFPVSDVAFTPAPIPGLATGYMGDYLGITAQSGHVYPCWTDNRDGFTMTYVSPYETGFAPFSSINPYPANNQQYVIPFTHFAWQDGTLEGDTATQYRIFIGTNNPPNNIINGDFVEDTFYLPPAGSLNGNTPYKWRIRAINDFGYTDSPVWSFRTAPPADEDFETGDLTAFEWYVEGDAEWSVEDGMTRNGLYSAQSGVINDGESSSLKVDLDCSSFDAINFWINVSSEENSDSLSFLIDGVVKESWSGVTGWIETQYTTGPGTHTFEWTYAKDESGAAGADAAWIDFIFFPELIGLTSTAGDDQIICEGSVASVSGVANQYEYVQWFTSGDGVFDNPQSLNADYIHGEADAQAEYVELSLTAYGVLEGDSVRDNLSLTIIPQPEAFAGNNTEVCEDDLWVASSATATNTVSLLWTTSGDGSFNDETILYTEYTPGVTDINNGSVELTLTVNGSAPCPQAESTVMLTINPLPLTPDQPMGPEYVDSFYTHTTEYETNQQDDAEEYVWTIMPEEAGTITGDSYMASVSWSDAFQGTALISVTAMNSCGNSAISEELEILVDNTVGTDEMAMKPIVIRPNPSTGLFVIEFGETAVNADNYISIRNAGGREIFYYNINEDETGKEINLTGRASGIYYVILSINSKKHVKKISLI